ncbi:DUF1850 domain-containing protein [Neobacillus niacini]|uniref:DUF1850 domain-containing protein n=1 Tax=Neobacillus niacini TaxID=86668 RepID=UPI0021CAE472|nr:DUF1850 domain-containing protein [Neobacillus niacini]MCM3764726.1 DUF1850 domain-containing protein [Neobacillus niacini]
MKENNRIIAICLISIIVITILAFIPSKKAIVFDPFEGKEKLAFIPIQGETGFKMKYTHSIHLSDVVESYKLTPDKQIQQYELMYKDFAIGMPANAEEGETFQQKDGNYYIKGMRRVFPYIILRIGQVRANHTVIYKQQEYPLSQFIKPGTPVRIEFRKLNFFQAWRGVNILESK